MSNISNLEDYRTPTPNTENSKVTNTRKYKDVREYLTSSEIGCGELFLNWLIKYHKAN
jgi:hypothetical protein